MKASDFVFCVDLVNDPDYPSFCITSQKYWDENGCLNDGGDDNDVEEFLPDHFHNLMEGCWEYAGGTWEQGKQALLAAGFVHNDGLDQFINRYESSED